MHVYIELTKGASLCLKIEKNLPFIIKMDIEFEKSNSFFRNNPKNLCMNTFKVFKSNLNNTF